VHDDVAISPARRSDMPRLEAMVGMHHDLIAEALTEGRCHVAERAGRPIGVVVLERSFYGNGFVSLLFVDAEHRRQGIATALMKHAERLCPTAKLFTSTNRSNEPMQRLCDALGYEPSGIIHNLDEGDPELVYVKRLRRP
jgi:GNAT superfamily N-acetyltransferase